MTDTLQPEELAGLTAVDPSGAKIGTVENVYLDDATGAPLWVTVTTGMFGNRQSFAPLRGAHRDGDNLVLTVGKDIVKDAPNVDDDGHNDQDDTAALFDYYRGYLQDAPAAAGGTAPVSADAATHEPGDRVGTDVDSDVDSEPDADADTGYDADVDPGYDTGGDDDVVMTRSEERLNVDTEQVESGRARLRKYVVTENVTMTVPVQREELRVEREPIEDGTAESGAEIGEDEQVVTLREERPVVTTETVPVERVRVGKETVTDEREVSGEIRKEQIDTPQSEDSDS